MTQGGKPQVGERIRVNMTGQPEDTRYGTVLKRTGGDLWSLYVHWENEKYHSVDWLLTASWFAMKGNLHVQVNGEWVAARP